MTFALVASFGRVLEFPRLREIALSLDLAASAFGGVRLWGRAVGKDLSHWE